MKLLVSLFLIFLLMVAPAGIAAETQNKEPFVAVFCSAGLECILPWKFSKTDLLFIGRNWDDFKPFLKTVKKQAGDRPIILDIDCHGTTKNKLLIAYNVLGLQRQFITNMGFVVNSIQEILPEHVQELDMESCFAGVVYSNSLKTDKEYHMCGDIEESADVYPYYPIYGVRNHPSYGNATFLQRNTYHVAIEDLRKFSILSPGKAREGTTRQDNLRKYLHEKGMFTRWFNEWKLVYSRVSVILLVQYAIGAVTIEPSNNEQEHTENGSGPAER